MEQSTRIKRRRKINCIKIARIKSSALIEERSYMHFEILEKRKKKHFKANRKFCGIKIIWFATVRCLHLMCGLFVDLIILNDSDKLHCSVFWMINAFLIPVQAASHTKLCSVQRWSAVVSFCGTSGCLWPGETKLWWT